jgi:stress response protein SCP2
MSILLQRGESVTLDRTRHDLSRLTIALGWRIRPRSGFLSWLFRSGGRDFDLDAIAFLLDAEDRVPNLGNERLQGGDVVFFNNLRHASGAVIHSGDNLVGGAGIEDNEQILVKLDELDKRFVKILFVVSIYQGEERGQHFGDIDRAFIRAVDGQGQEIARFNLSAEYELMRTVVFGEVARTDDGWQFSAVGRAYSTDSFVDLLRDHVK